ncbi:MAG: hypothetical protein KGJ84_10890 [Elusimicrobia bacterium]|nr:hypothetical protein [Elusimicrobiota bacterium]
MADENPASFPGDDRLARDFEALRRNSAERAPATLADLILFLASAALFEPAGPRRRPRDSGQCKL